MSSSNSAATSSSWLSKIYGIGALSGKAIQALGEATLDGLEGAAVWQRIALISLYIPRDDAAPAIGVDVDNLYDDLLELSRYVRLLDLYLYCSFLA
jgi:hypothetical protein